MTGERNEKKNWCNAETYVKMFYENIIPAVLEKNQENAKEKALTVLKSLQFSESTAIRYHVVNCFEVVLAMHFINAQVIKELWDDFVADCQSRDSELPEWSESTVNRLRSSVFQILEQAGYIDSTKSLRLQTVHIAAEVVRYLENNDEGSVLRCIQVTP